jgi:hypothetical protein
MWRRLQPHVAEAATLCGGGCNPWWRRLQPYVKRGVWPCCGYGEQPAVGAIQAHRLDEPGRGGLG